MMPVILPLLRPIYDQRNKPPIARCTPTIHVWF